MKRRKLGNERQEFNETMERGDLDKDRENQGHLRRHDM